MFLEGTIENQVRLTCSPVLFLLYHSWGLGGLGELEQVDRGQQDREEGQGPQEIRDRRTGAQEPRLF